MSPYSNNVAANKISPYSNNAAPIASKVEAANKIMPQATGNNAAPITTKVQAVANKMAPTANKIAPYGNQAYAGYKPLPAELEQQSYKTNSNMTYSTANTAAYAANQKPVVYSSYNNPPYYYGHSNQGYSNQVYPNQGNWGYVQPMNMSGNMMPSNMSGGFNGTPILAQSAMYPPTPQQTNYYQPWQADCGCGGNQAYTMNQSANKFAAMNEPASKVLPAATKGKRSGKKVNITATKKKAKKSGGNKPWLNV
jgi:hypothetical protein